MDNGRNVTLLIDGSHHSMRIMSVCKKEDTAEEGYQIWKYMYLRSIFNYIEKFNADEVVVALDSKNNWRKKIFPFYKSRRKGNRDREDEDDTWFNFEEYFKIHDEFLEQIQKNLPFKFVKVDTAEADDIIGVLCNNSQVNDNAKIIISTDRDFVQLLDCPFISFFNPIDKNFVKCDNPKHNLYRKILLGDKGDDVPSIDDKHNFKSEFLQYCVSEGVAENEHNAKIKLEFDENLMLKMEHSFQEKYPIKAATVRIFSKKIVESLIETNTIKEFLNENSTYKEKFLRNNKLVNLKAQPKELVETILNVYKETKIISSLSNLYMFFVSNTFTEFMNDSTHITKLLKTLH